MKQFLLRLLAFALIVGALVWVLAPVVKGQYWLWQGAKAVSGYRQTAAGLDTLASGTLLAQARAYNDAMDAVAMRDPFEQTQTAQAVEALELNGDGVMAVLSIPKLGEAMPVYREGALEQPAKGVSHLSGSSLPVGGEGAYCALFGERAGRFSGLDRLIAGDCFYIEAVQDTLIYEVEQVLPLEPDALADQLPEAEADICALVTTANRDDGPQRLLVRARRVDRQAAPISDATQPLPEWEARGILALPVLAIGLVIMVLTEALRAIARRRRLRRVRL
ncbi:MAG: sortase [Clostridia bacterium]|nr:sortase [Clostridia bacterium]